MNTAAPFMTHDTDVFIGWASGTIFAALGAACAWNIYVTWWNYMIDMLFILDRMHYAVVLTVFILESIAAGGSRSGIMVLAGDGRYEESADEQLDGMELRVQGRCLARH